MSLKITSSQIIQNPKNEHLQSMDNLQRGQQQYRQSNQNKFVRATQIAIRSIQNFSKMSKNQRDENLTNIQKRDKMPESLKRTLRQKAKQSGKFHQQASIKKSKYGQMISSKIKKEVFVCGICFSEMNQKQNISLCNCPHIFCASCLNQYVLYKISMFEQIPCPNQNCNVLMSQQTYFYKNLPHITKQKYSKIHNFYVAADDPTLKLCPKQLCDGIIKIIQNQPRICDRCQTQFCPKCYFKKHQGECDKNQIDFFQNNLHYRQCSNCKFVVQRTEGCNHMTCICKHQFCYICGGNWNAGHLCNGTQQQGQGNYPQQPCCDCSACDEHCGPVSCIFKFPFKLILYLLFLLCVLFVFLNKIMILVMLFVFVVLAGLFFFSIDFICQLFEEDKNGLGCLMIILFPIAMIIGVGIAIKQVMCEMMANEFTQLCQMITEGSSGIWNI